MNTVLVTGGSKGIGSAIAEEFASLVMPLQLTTTKVKKRQKHFP